MDDSTSNCQLNQSESFEYKSGIFWCNLEKFGVYLQPLCDVDKQFVPKVVMIFNTVEDATKFYKDYSKAANFSTRVWSINKKENKIKNQLITYSREGKWKSKISPMKKTNPSAGLNCPARIYIHILKDIGVWIISKIVNWNNFLMKYGLVDNKWLSEFYKDHHIWIPIYLDHHFWAGMRSTQRSESMHAFFNKFITQNNSLIQFVKQYDNCLGSREQRERESDAADFHTVIPCATKSSIEAQFQQVYTHQKFRKVQVQFRGKVNCITRSTNSALGYSVYEDVEQVSNSTFNKFTVR
ncbi:hypothetical protein Ahy_B06g081081 [Arachis hypogaea]|uniref:Protein FAR1-RELATED SEQUENCE n=1 Tax=Arachis hypogaea TaxID=3818 RepID=A0A444YJY8_ARAHY|nr:hypothetical protein Ahy_B06g081081 [Arachis hypogaea]